MLHVDYRSFGEIKRNIKEKGKKLPVKFKDLETTTVNISKYFCLIL